MTITDGTLTATSALNITLAAVNDAPVTANDTASFAEDTTGSGNVLTNDSDVEGTALTVSEFTVAGDATVYAAGTPAVMTGKGTLNLAANGAWTFTPEANWNGVAPVVTYKATDGALSTTGTLTLTVTAVNDAPVAATDTATGTEDTVLTGNVITNDSDVDGTTPTVASFTVTGVGTAVAGGTLTIAGKGTLTIAATGAWTFTPVANWNGAAPVVTVTITDGTLTATSALNITLAAVNDAPVTANDTASFAEDTTGSGNVLTNDSDVEGTALTVSEFTVAGDATVYAAGTPAVMTGKGTLNLAANGAWTFTPEANWNGVAPVVTYKATDGALSTTGTLTLTVTAVNDAPVAATDTATGTEDTVLTGNVITNDSDVDGTTPTVASFTVTGVGTAVAGGTLTIAGKGTLTIAATGAWTFTPVANWNGAAPVVTVTITDGTLTATSALNITLAAVNDAPVTANDTASFAEDTTGSGNVLTNDSDVEGTALTVSEFTVAGDATVYAAGTPAVMTGKGTLNLAANGAWTFTPEANWNGVAPVVTYKATDGALSTTGTLTLTVTAVNDAPVAATDTATGTEDTVLTGNVITNDSDVDGTTPTVASFTVTGVGTAVAGGTLTIAGKGTLTIAATGAWTFTPVANWNGAAPVVTVTITDGTLTATSSLNITLAAVNDAPVTVADSFSFARNTSGSGNVLTNDSDVDGDVLSLTAIAVTGFVPTGLTCVITGKGTLTFSANGFFTFVPVTGWFGTLPTVTYTVSDGKTTSTGTVAITVL